MSSPIYLSAIAVRGFTERYVLPGTGVTLDIYGHVHFTPIKHPVRGYTCALVWSRTVRAYYRGEEFVPVITITVNVRSEH